MLRCVHAHLRSCWVADYRVIPDDRRTIESSLFEMCDRARCDIIITTGGTGAAIRDVTPEATEAVCDRMFPGLGEHMRAISMRYVSTAVLSRQTAGLRGTCLILNLPGNPKSVQQILPEVLSSVAHAVQLAGGARMLLNSRSMPTAKGMKAEPAVGQKAGV